MPMRYFAIRLTHLYAGMIGIVLLLASYYFQYVKLLQPCPLCLVQRLILMVMVLFFFISVFVKRKILIRILMTSLFIFSVGGIATAARKVMLEYTSPDRVTSCIPDLNYMLHHLPLQDTLSLLFQGSEGCAEIDWQFLSLSMSEWTLGFFVAFALLSIINSIRCH